VEHAVLHCNVGLLALRLRRYATARRALDNLARALEPLDEPLAVRCCFALLDALASQVGPSLTAPTATPRPSIPEFRPVAQPHCRAPSSCLLRLAQTHQQPEVNYLPRFERGDFP
jgi:hypothetical protein